MKTYFPERLAKFGTNPFGENIYRLIWSEDRMTLSYGKEMRKYGDGFDRFILEKWVAPEMWGDEETHDEEALGPFPRAGEFEHCWTFQDEHGTMLKGSDLLPLLDLMCACIERGKMTPIRERIAAHKAEQLHRENETA